MNIPAGAHHPRLRGAVHTGGDPKKGMDMGYTHYWHHRRKFTKADWTRVSAAFSKIVEEAFLLQIQLSVDDETPLSAHGRLGVKWLMEDAEGPFFQINGVGTLAHETFRIAQAGTSLQKWQRPEDKGFAFCKTAEKPYDAVVTAMLIWLESSYPKHIQASSDGYIQNWQDGMDIALRAFPDRPDLDYPRSMRFDAQWRKSHLSSAKHSLYERIDDAVCILQNGRVIWEFHGTQAAEIARDAESLHARVQYLDPQRREVMVAKYLRTLSAGADIIGATAPASQILVQD